MKITVTRRVLKTTPRYHRLSSSRLFLRAFSSEDSKRSLSKNDSGRLNRMSSIQFMPSAVDDPVELSESLANMQSIATRERVPWFQSAMPPSYFRQVSKERRLQHLISVAAVADLQDVPFMVSRHQSDTGELTAISVISSGEDTVGKLEQALNKLPQNANPQSVNLYTSTDKLLTITDFGLHQPVSADISLPRELQAYVTELMNGDFEEDRKQYLTNIGEILHAKPSDHFKEENLLDFIKKIVSPGMWNVSPRRFCKFVEMYHLLLQKGTDEVLLDVESNYGGFKGKTMYTLALTNVLIKPTLARLCRYLEANGIAIERCHVEQVIQDRNVEESESKDYNDVTFLRIVVDHPDSNQELFDDLKAALPLVAKWYDDSIVNSLYKLQEKHKFATELKLKAVDLEVLTGLMECVHLISSGTQMYEFSKPNITQVMNRPQAFRIVELFKNRFNPFEDHPEKDDQVFQSRMKEIKESYDQYIEVDIERKVLDKMLDVVANTERTNLFNTDRFAFALKLNPIVCMDPKDTLRTTQPFGVFFVNGRRFRGLHVRFREIARGGLRLVTPNSSQSLTIESTRQYAECYDLAFAQQLKNKDIAEGGSKAVCLIDTDSNAEGIDRKHLLRKSVKAFVNSLLDLITVNEVNKTEELIFLGPDEQIAIEHINWIVRRAAERNYRMPSAFMSSKPDQGINHKEFGVTSEGVAVFLDTALKTLDILDQPSFTVKITGGPDGDVAGNMLKILYREYGEKCKIVGIADGTGCVEDQINGIEWSELLRLVDESLPLDQIDKSKLAPTTEVYNLEKAEGVLKRNTMHNRVVADAFIPGGGRPQAINETNWKQFLVERNGKKVPTSKLIVEGANLFLTNFAREKLAEYGCVIVKDSSANKCGVICSAFEIISCMLLEKQQFLDIKSVLVPQVVEKLQMIARREAELLMTEYRKHTTVVDGERTNFNLLSVSIEVSHAINRTTDCIRSKLQELVATDPGVLAEYKPLVKAFLPEELVKAGWHDFDNRVPEIYVVNLVSTILACELVYNEGIDFVSAIPDDTVLTETAFQYVREKDVVAKLVEALESCGSNVDTADMGKIKKLLQLGGPRAALMAGGSERL